MKASEDKKMCLCGCGQEVKSRFAQGHDARAKGQLIRIAVAKAKDGELVNRTDLSKLGYKDTSLIPHKTMTMEEAEEAITAHGWTRFLEAKRAKLGIKATDAEEARKGRSLKRRPRKSAPATKGKKTRKTAKTS